MAVSKLIVAVHFDVLSTDIEAIQEIIETLQTSFDNITHVDLLSEKDYHADIYSPSNDVRILSDDERLTEYYDQQVRNRRYDEAPEVYDE